MMSSKAYLNLTPEQQKVRDEARRRQLAAEKALREAVEKALRERERRVKELVEEQRGEMARSAVERLRGSGRLETVAASSTVSPAATASGGGHAPNPWGGAPPAEAPEEGGRRGAAETVALARTYFSELQDVCPVTAATLEDLAAELDEGMERRRLDLIFDSVRAALAKEVSISIRTGFCREELMAMASQRPAGFPGDEFVRKINMLLTQKRVHPEEVAPIREEYLALLESDRAAAESLRLLRRARRLLSERGYMLLDAKGRTANESFPLARDGVYYFIGSNPDIRVRCQVDRHGGMSLQQVRVVATREESRAEASVYQKELEREESLRWCEAQSELVRALESEGAAPVHTIGKEAGSAPLPILVDRHKDRFGKAAIGRIQAGKPAVAREADAVTDAGE
jgi:hypothetical protein